MNWDLLFDPLFRLPFAAGLALAAALPALGVLLRLRDEWLAALGLAHLAGAGALVGLAAGLPAVAGAAVGALSGAAVKSRGRFRGNTVYGLMVLTGWSATLLVAANTPLGSALGEALVEGQLYFAGGGHLAAAGAVAVLAAAVLPWAGSRLVRARLNPVHERANRLPAWRWHLSFDVLTALTLAVATAVTGLMGAFALAFVPPWAAFRAAPSWRGAFWISCGLGVVAYTLAFALALLLDQPFAPVLVAVVMGLAAPLRLLKPAGAASG